MRLWDPRRETEWVKRDVGHSGGVFAGAFGQRPDGSLLFASSGTQDGTVRLRDPASSAALGELVHIRCVCVFSIALGALPRGRLVLASATAVGGVPLWDASTGKPLHKPHDHDNVDGVALGLLPDGRRVLASGAMQTGASVGPEQRHLRGRAVDLRFQNGFLWGAGGPPTWASTDR